MPLARRLWSLLALGGLLAALLVVVADDPVASQACAEPGEPLTFTEPTYVDTTRAGGEPMIQTHPDGTLLYGSHAGTTHFFGPAAGDPNTAAFVQNYKGQAYIYRSDDNGETWNFVDRTVPTSGVVNSGFSDPDFAIDTEGNVYFSEINLVNVAVSKSTDSARSFELQNFFGLVMHDRQWKEADTEDVVYMVGNSFMGGTFPNDPVGSSGIGSHYLYKSSDGGATWTPGISDPGGLGDLRVDRSDGTLYEANLSGGTLRMSVFRNIRDDDFARERYDIATGVSMLSHWPSFDLDPSGNLYITWDESGRGARAAGVWYSYSTDRGETWAEPVRVDTDDRTDIWPWLAVGDDGRVAVAWFGNDNRLPGHDAEDAGPNDPWNVYMAQSLNGLGCEGSEVPGFSVSRATPEPFHTGTVCQGGTICQARLVDRRLGDYFAIEIDGTGAVVAAYSDTREGGSVALPGFLRQTGGPSFFAEP